jgi:hypothetical protein
MDNIIEPGDSFDFSSLSLAHPTGIQGGSYFTRIQYNNKPLYIQTCQSLTKQGFVKSGKKYHCDLMFDKNADVMINWFETLEETCQKLIYEKADTWFQNALEMSDVESAFNSIIRVYRSGKYYLVRTNIKNSSTTNEPLLKIYDENEIPQSMKDIQPETKIISILEIQGIKFTTRNFQIEIEMKQAMVIHDEPIFESCLIKTSKPYQSQHQQQTTEIKEQVEQEEEIKEQEEQEEKNGENEKKQSQIPTLENNSLDNVTYTENDEDKDLETVDHLELLDELDFMNKQNENENDKEKDKYIGNITTSRQEVTGTNTYLENEDKESNIDIPVEVLDIDIEELEESKDFKEVQLAIGLDSSAGNNLEKMTLKKPNEVYFNLYKQARNKAKEAKKAALIAYLEAKKIKKTYMLESLNDEESDFDDEIEDVSESELDGL